MELGETTVRTTITLGITFLLLFLGAGCAGDGPPNDDDDAGDDDAGDDDAGDDDGGDDDAGDDDAGDDDAGDDDGGDDDGGDDDTGTPTPCEVLTFTSASGTPCGVTWMEGIATLILQDPPNGTCAGEVTGGDVWVYPGLLRAEYLPEDCEVTMAEVDVTDWAGIGAATVTLLDASDTAIDSGGNTVVGSMDTVTVGSLGGPISTALTVLGFETQIHEIRLY